MWESGDVRARASCYSLHWIDVNGQLRDACHVALGKRVNWRLGVPQIQSRLSGNTKVTDLLLH
jgi:hypothetical protein